MAFFSDFRDNARTLLNGDKYFAVKRANSYERFFEGYEESTRIGPDGRRRIIRTYTAEYYRAARAKRSLFVQRSVYVLLTAASAVLFVFGALRPSAYNTVWYAGILEAFCLVLVLLEASAAINCLCAPVLMEIRAYKGSSVRLITAAKELCLVFPMLLGSVIIYALLSGDADITDIFWIAFSFAGAGICQLCIYFLEKHVPYEQVPAAVE